MKLKIAIVDSGINAEHPHVGGIAGGVSLVSDDYVDHVGHGTAVAGAIREKAPDAELYAVKIFDRRLSTKFHVLQRALEWCDENRMDVINLSVGTTKPLPEIAPIVVSVSGFIAVQPDPACPRDAYFYREGTFYASPHPRPIPGVPVERNLQGASFAVANMTGFVARALAQTGRDSIRSVLIAQAANNL
jgi:subtilisin family serine protease